MDFIPLNINIKEALQLVQYHSPEKWQSKLVDPQTVLLNKQIQLQSTLTKALNAIQSQNTNIADSIYISAAFQDLMNKKVEKYHETLTDIERINTQILHLGTNKTITAKDKSELRKFYMSRLKVLDAQRKKLLSSKEVCRAIDVSYEEVSADSK